MPTAHPPTKPSMPAPAACLPACRQVFSVDCNPAQSALLELKAVAIRQCGFEDVWALFGEGRVSGSWRRERQPAPLHWPVCWQWLPAGSTSTAVPWGVASKRGCRPLVKRTGQTLAPIPPPPAQHPRAEELFERKLAPFLSQASLRFWRPRLH